MSVADVEIGSTWDWAEHFLIRLIKAPDLIHRHLDARLNVTMMLLDDMVAAGVDGYQAIEPGAGMDLSQIKRDYGHRLTLVGNVDCATVLVEVPIEAVRAQTEWVIRTAAPGGGFLFSTSNSVHPGVKPEYYLAMLETAREAGTYPIGP